MHDRINDYIIFNRELSNATLIPDEILLDGPNLYDVIRIIKSTPIFIEDHFNRLRITANQLGITLQVTQIELKDLIDELIRTCKIGNGNIKIVISFNKTRMHRNLIGYFIKTRYPKDSDYKQGVDTLSLKEERSRPGIKLINKELRNKTNKLIDDSGVYEVILIDREGNITEGSRSNIFLIKNNEVFTSPVVDVLPGITRANVIKICNKLGLKVTEKKISFSELENLDGAFITGTSPKVLPVKQVDRFSFNSESIILHQIMKGFDMLIEDYIRNYNKYY